MLRARLAHLAQDRLDLRGAGHLAVQADKLEVVVNCLGSRLINVEVPLAGILVHRNEILNRQAFVMVHCRAVDAASGAGTHFDEAAAHIAADNILNRGDAVFEAVDRHVCIIRIIARHRAQNAARRREQARAALIVFVLAGLHRDLLAVQPSGQLLKGQDAVDIRTLVALRLFGDTGANKDRLGLRVLLLDTLAVRLHR